MRKTICITLILLSLVFQGLSTPKQAKADVTDFASDAACSLYASTVGKIKDNIKKKAAEKAKKEAEEKAKQKAEEEAAKKAAKEAEDKLGIKIGLSNPVPVIDESQIKKIADASESEKEQDRELSCKESVRKFLLSTFKKQILDRMVDEIVAWIQNGNSSKPRFLTDTRGFLEEAKQRAIGDVAEEIAPFLCSPFKLDIQIGLMEPGPFARKTQCTLETITKNVNDFGKSFQSAGWLGYNEVLKPQNNRWGAELLAQDEVFRRIQAKTEAAKIEVTMNQGYFGSQECLKWSFVDTRRNIVVDRIPSIIDPGRIHIIPNANQVSSLNKKLQELLPPGSTIIPAEKTASDLGMSAMKNDLLGYAWKCVEREITTPGRLVGDIVAKGVGADIDFIVNADDLSEYLAAIADAAISRLTRETVSGIRDLYKDNENSLARGKTEKTNCDSFKQNGVETELSRACEQATRFSKNSYSISKEKLLALIESSIELAANIESKFKTGSEAIENILGIIGTESDVNNSSLLSCLKTKGDTENFEEYKKVPENLKPIKEKELPEKNKQLEDIKKRIITTKEAVNKLKDGVTQESAALAEKITDLESETQLLNGEIITLEDNLSSLLKKVIEEFLQCKEDITPKNPTP